MVTTTESSHLNVRSSESWLPLWAVSWRVNPELFTSLLATLPRWHRKRITCSDDLWHCCCGVGWLTGGLAYTETLRSTQRMQLNWGREGACLVMQVSGLSGTGGGDMSFKTDRFQSNLAAQTQQAQYLSFNISSSSAGACCRHTLSHKTVGRNSKEGNRPSSPEQPRAKQSSWKHGFWR